MSVRLVGNVVKEGYDHWFCVIGWIKSSTPTNDFDNIPIKNNKAKPGGVFLIEKHVPDYVSPWNLYEYACEQNESKIRDFDLLKRIDAKPVIYDNAFWIQMQDGLFYLNYTKVKECLGKESLERAFILKNINDTFVYGLFDGKTSYLEKYDVRKESLLKQVDRGVFKYGFVFENSLKRNSTKIDCSSSEQLEEWFKKEFELDINKFLLAEPSLQSLEKVRWQRTRGLMDEFILQEEDLRKLFERTQNSGFGKDIIEAAKKAIKDNYTNDLYNSDSDLRDLMDKKNAIENEIKALEAKKNNVEREIEQDALRCRVQFEGNLNELKTKREEIEKDYIELIEAKNQKENEIKELEKQKNSLITEQARIAKENNQKINCFEKALQNVKEKYSDLLDGLKVLTSEKDDGEEILLPIYENDEDVDGAEEEWNGIPRASIVESIKQVCRRVEDCGLCKVYELHVEHDWLHYSDFVNHGLIKIWKEAASNSAIHFVLVLDSLNLTHPECGMKPLLDSFECKIPLLGTKLKRPENLKIMATLLPTEGDGAIGQDISAVIKWPKLET